MDASLPEFLLLFVIGLLVLGPERMAQVAKKIGHFVGYARRMSRNFQVQLEDELEMKQIRDSLPKRVDLRKELGLDEIENDVRAIGEEVSGKTTSHGVKLPAKTAGEDADGITATGTSPSARDTGAARAPAATTPTADAGETPADDASSPPRANSGS